MSVASDPASRPMESWRAALMVFKSRGVAEDDPRIIECRSGLAFHKVHRAISAVSGELSPPGVDRLTAELREAVAS